MRTDIYTHDEFAKPNISYLPSMSHTHILKHEFFYAILQKMLQWQNVCGLVINIVIKTT